MDGPLHEKSIMKSTIAASLDEYKRLKSLENRIFLGHPIQRERQKKQSNSKMQHRIFCLKTTIPSSICAQSRGHSLTTVKKRGFKKDQKCFNVECEQL